MKNLHEHSYTKLSLLPTMLVVLGLCFLGCPKKAVPPIKEKKVEIKKPIKEPKPASLPKKIVKPQPTEPIETILPVTNEPAEPKRVPDVTFVVSQYEKVYFEFDKSRIQTEARQTLQKNAEKIRHDLQQYPDLKLLVEGHCDERGANEYNLSLGERRAFSVRDYLISLGISSNVLFTKSWGEEKPVDLGHDEDIWAKNRRAEFQVYTGY
jgi:peptidoglycan-associated lipoprotein